MEREDEAVFHPIDAALAAAEPASLHTAVSSFHTFQRSRTFPKPSNNPPPPLF